MQREGTGRYTGHIPKGVALEPWRMIWLTMKPMGRERERGIVVARL